MITEKKYFEKVDSSKHGHHYGSLHLDMFNCFVENVSLFFYISSIREWMHLLMSTFGFLQNAKAKKVNHTQCIPHIPAQACKDILSYENFMLALQPTCPIFSQLLQTHLPEEYNNLATYCNLIPYSYTPPTHAFHGVVANLQVATNSHKDVPDDAICIIMPWGFYTGGECVFEEVGLVIDLPSGSGVTFPSYGVTHYNLHFTGWRASTVCHSEKEGCSWVQHKNGWYEHVV
jgi:hypothetical protein